LTKAEPEALNPAMPWEQTPMSSNCNRFLHYLDQHKLPLTAADVRSAGRGGAILALTSHAPSPGRHYPPVEDLILSIVHRSSRATVTRDVGLGSQTFKDAPSLMLITPARTASFWSFSGAPRVLHIALPWREIGNFHDIDERQAADNLRVLAGGPFEDAMVTAVAWRMWLAATRRGPAAELFMEHALRLLLSSLLMTATDRYHGQRTHAERLASWQVERVNDYMERRLSEGVRLADMARITGLSPYHFLRAFKGATGCTPHQWFTNKRIDRAKELMMESQRSLTSIAFELGFSSPGHFSSTFRRAAGVAPTDWRRNFTAQDL
jgi:AraC family transcriptional regulator